MKFTLAGLRVGAGRAMTLTGKMEIHGVARDVEIPCEAEFSDDGGIHVKGELWTKMSLFGVSVPVKAGVLKVKDDIRIWFEIRAEPAGKMGA